MWICGDRACRRSFLLRHDIRLRLRLRSVFVSSGSHSENVSRARACPLQSQAQMRPVLTSMAATTVFLSHPLPVSALRCPSGTAGVGTDERQRQFELSSSHLSKLQSHWQLSMMRRRYGPANQSFASVDGRAGRSGIVQFVRFVHTQVRDRSPSFGRKKGMCGGV